MNFLKFATEAACLAAFAPFMQPDETGTPRYPSYIGKVAVDVIGLIYKPTGEMLQSADGPYPEFAALDGWHVNLSGPAPEELQAFVITAPSTPSRVFA